MTEFDLSKITGNEPPLETDTVPRSEYDALLVTSNTNAMEAVAARAAMPTMDAAHRFMFSSPQTSWEMLIQILGLGAPDEAKLSGGKLRELWKAAGGMVDKRGRAWVEMDQLPGLLRTIIDAAAMIPSTSQSEVPSNG